MPSDTIRTLHPRSLKSLSGTLTGLVSGRLWLQVVIGMVLGLAVGILIGPSVGLVPAGLSASIGSWLALPGQLFLALIQMIVIPLVFASIIRGVAASEDLDQLRQLGSRLILFFGVATVLAIVIGLFAVIAIQPGAYIDSETVRSTLGTAATAPVPASPTGAENAPLKLGELPQKLLTLLPSNPLTAMVRSEMLQVVIFSIVVGIALVMMAPAQARPLLDLLGSLQAVCMTVVRWAMWLAPVAVFGLLAQLTAKLGLDALLGMAVYVGTVLLGLAVLLVVYLLVVFFVAARNPFAFLRATREVLLLAFSTSSSAAVMPLSIRTAEGELRVRPSIGQFVIPIGATMNMGGTALYQGVAAVFLAQVFGIDLDIGAMVLIVVTAVGASIGTPATPGVGIVILTMVLGSVGVPAAGIALIIGVDRILDMSRTALNVCGDLVAAVVMERWVGGRGSAEEQIAREEEREIERVRRDADVVVEPPPTSRP